MGCESEDDLFEQTLEEGNEPLDFTTDKVVSQEKNHTCTFEGCGAKFNRPYRLKQHLLVHKGEKPFQCTHEGCEKGYTSNTHLQRHIAANHSPSSEFKKSFKCTYPGCGATIRHESNLRRHYMRAHEPRKQKYECSQCSYSFCKQQQLITHEAQHSGEPAYRCEVCGLCFARKRLLIKHNQSHRIYKCDFPGCSLADFEFKKFWDFQRHRTSFHPCVFCCGFCGRQFAMKARLRVHMNSHLDNRSKEVFVCPYSDCSRYYYHKRNLQNHIRRLHEGDRCNCPYEECDKTFSSLTKLKEHMKLHDPNYNSGRVYKRGAERKQRKDTGVPHRSFAVKLAGLSQSVPFEYEKAIMDGNDDNYKAPSPYDSMIFTDSLNEDDNHPYIKEEVTSD